MKTGVDHHVPLTDATLEAIKPLCRISPYIVPADKESKFTC